MEQKGLDIYNTEKHSSQNLILSQYLLHNGLSSGDSFQLLVISYNPVLTAVAENRRCLYCALIRCRYSHVSHCACS